MRKLPVLIAASALAAVVAPAQDWAKARLEKSPRHQEWVKVKHGPREVNCFIVYPEVKEKATAVLVIHEIFGLSEWVRGVADQVIADLNAVADYVAKLPACSGKLAVGGFCWGGGQTFRFATNHKNVKAAFVFYGTGPEKEEDIARINGPVYGFYGGNDARVNATIPKSTELMKKAGKTYEPVTYDGAGHGFMRAGEAPEPAADASDKAKSDHAANKKA